MRIGIIGFANITYMPYLKYYTEVFDERNIEYELIYWDRKDLNEAFPQFSYAFKERMSDSEPKLMKLIMMLKYLNYVKNIIKNRDYDFLVILTTIPAVLLSKFLKKYYRNKYLVDIRDYTYERVWIYKHYLKEALNNAALRVISSPAYQNFLPSGEYVVCHNMGIRKKNFQRSRSKLKSNKEVINVSYIGAISYFEEVIKFIDIIRNDKRFIFSIIGSGTAEEKLKKYVESGKINNVKFYGMYRPDEKERFYLDTDIIFNAYGNKSLAVKYAISNKMYDALWFRIPILVSPNTEMASMANYIGFELDYRNKNLANQLYNWYKFDLDWNRFETISNEIISKVEQDNEIFKERLINTLMEME